MSFKHCQKLKSIWLSTILVLSILAPAPLFATPSLTPIRVVASFTIAADLVQQVGGDKVHLTVLIDAQQDAHSFEPRAEHSKALSQAQLLFINGLDFEPWLPRLKKSSGFAGQEVILSKGIHPLSIDEDEHEEHATPQEHAHHHHHGHEDPHAWHSVSNVIIYVQNIKQALIQVDPENTPYYSNRADLYIQQLKQLEQEIIETVQAIPLQNRLIVTPHHSFGYFANAYGFRTLSPLGVTNEALPSAYGIAKLIEQIRHEKIPALFLDANSNPRIIQQISRETGVGIGGSLHNEAVSTEKYMPHTYIDMMRANLKILQQALATPAL